MFNLKCNNMLSVLLLVTITLVSARNTNSYTQQNAIPHGGEEESRAASSTTFLNPETIAPYFGDLRFLYKIYHDCSSNGELSTCLKMKLVTGLDRVSRQYNELSLIDGITFVRDTNTIDTSAPIHSEADLEASLPRALNERDDRLNSLILGKVIDFFRSHSLQVKLPSILENEERSLNGEEGRKKKNKMGMMMPAMMMSVLMSLAFGALALLAGKALIVAKIALVLASIIGLKKLFGGSGGGHENVEVVAGGHGTGGWGRAFDDNNAQQIAYNAYFNQQTNKKQQ